MKHDIDGSGEREIRCSVYTLTVYEQEFKSSMVKDIYGVIDLRANGAEVVTAEYVANRLAAAMPEGEDGKRRPLPKATLALVARAFPDTIVTTIDYTADNWEAYVRAYWAMLRTGDALSGGAQTTPSFEAWVASIGDVDLKEVSNTVLSCMEDGVFHPRAPRR